MKHLRPANEKAGGSIKKTEPITEADDLEQAKEQQQRLAHARIPLDRAVTDAVKGDSGYRAVEIEPTVDRAGKPVASVTQAHARTGSHGALPRDAVAEGETMGNRALTEFKVLAKYL